MGGSGWSSPAVLTTEDGQKFFAKESKGRGIEMFRGEAKGLQALSAAAGIASSFVRKGEGGGRDCPNGGSSGAHAPSVTLQLAEVSHSIRWI